MMSVVTVDALARPPVRHVFVYGTLRRGEQRDIQLLQPPPGYVGRGSASGILYNLGDYPGMQPGSRMEIATEKVFGEVYAISAELEQILDEIEEISPQPSGEYIKRDLWVRLDAPSCVQQDICCLVYVVAPEHTQGKVVIASGDWVKHRLGKTR